MPEAGVGFAIAGTFLTKSEEQKYLAQINEQPELERLRILPELPALPLAAFSSLNCSMWLLWSLRSPLLGRRSG
jgi:hypothetical protein